MQIQTTGEAVGGKHKHEHRQLES